MSNDAWNIRKARIKDARAIAEVHAESYKRAYRGIFPDAFLDGVSVETREPVWRQWIATRDPSAITLVGCDADGAVVGFASGGKERTGQLGCDGELYAIYLHPEAQRKRLGASLVQQFMRELVARRVGSMAVWVLERNPSKAFYERLGGKVIGEQQIERGGQRYIEVAYGWADLSVINYPLK